MAMEKPGSGLAEITGHDFADPSLLREALTHPSASQSGIDYQRLEFLGDRVVGLVVADILLRDDAGANEGELAVRFNDLVRRGSLATAARAAGLGQHIILGKSERNSAGQDRDAVLSDVFEAVVAALYVDSGLPVAARFIKQYLATQLAVVHQVEKDAKSSLQEFVQGRGGATPKYITLEQQGPAHAPRFLIEVVIEGEETMQGEGGSKQIAEQQAAKLMLERLRK